MEFAYLSDTVGIKKVSETPKQGIFEVEGLYNGYGITVGNAIRRVLLSSIPGAAVTQVKIKGVGHEFTAVPNVLEDVVEISMNLKKVRFQVFTNEPQVLTLKVKGEKKVSAEDIETNAQVKVINPEAHIATLTSKGAELEMELTVERGIGYVPIDSRKAEKLPIGVIALDAIFTPVSKVNFTVENMRVGDRTDYNRLKLDIETDGSVSPSAALRKASKILQDHFMKMADVEVSGAEPEMKSEVPAKEEAVPEKEEKETKKKTAKKKKAE